MTSTEPGPHAASGHVLAATNLISTWDHLVQQIASALRLHGVAAQHAVVLLPYLQLAGEARRAWARTFPDGFSPRFETTRTWAASIEPFSPGPTDLSQDTARDVLVASAMVDGVARGRIDATLRGEMVARLIEAARQLAPWAAAQTPPRRSAWAAGVLPALRPPAGLQGAAHWEALVNELALAWVANAACATDVLWSERAAPRRVAHLLLVVPGHQQDPLTQALCAHWGTHAQALVWPAEAVARTAEWQTPLRVHAADDAEDEAQLAAACVIAHLNAGRKPVALVAIDRLLTRRVGALLGGAGVAVRDETGWRLSTTHAAASLMNLLRAADPRCDTDDVIDLLKSSALAPDAAVRALERAVRGQAVARWRDALTHPVIGPLIPESVQPLLQSLQTSRPLLAWLQALTEVLTQSGQWAALQGDAAGRQVMAALRLGEHGGDLPGVIDGLAPLGAVTARWPLSVFSAWVRDVMEGTNFTPETPADAPVVVLALPQLLGRELAAAVAPGCDEMRLSASPPTPGGWSASQRAALGMPSREDLARTARQGWETLLVVPFVDLIWRQRERDETLNPNPWLLELDAAQAPDPRPRRAITVDPVSKPQPRAPDLVPDTVSASAYQDLRTCPYRFFALRQLRLDEQSELGEEPDQRDFGNWLHAVLRRFHEQRGAAPRPEQADRAALDAMAAETARAMGFASEEGAASFLPYRSQWPSLRDGYLSWLAAHEANGPRFDRAEVALRQTVGPWTLYGKLDRIDLQPSPEGPMALVIDYKTESRSRTQDRLREPLEDTQLAFYAALLPDDTVRAAYLSITDTRGANDATRLFENADVLPARDALRQGLVHDLDRLAAGAPLPALGEGRACDHCAARGLCRKDFWA